MSRIAPPFKPLRAYANWGRANLEMLRRSGRISARPLKLTIDPTNVCQLRCPLCPTGAGLLDRQAGHVALDAIEALIDEVGDYVFFIDFFNWGEPLLNPRLEDMIARAERKRISTQVSSNLSLPLSDERIRRLIESGLHGLVCSIDGASQETYGKYRRRGSFDLAFGNMERILAMRRAMSRARPVLTWQFLVFKFNQHEMEAAQRMASAIGVDRLSFEAPFVEPGRYGFSAEDAAEMRAWIPDDPRFNRYDPRSPHYVSPHEAARTRKRCDWHYVSTAVNWDGAVAPCCTVHETKDDFGRLQPGRAYMDVVNNEAFVGIRERFAGRRRVATGLVCETCPTPFIMGYASAVNRRIAFFVFVRLLEAIRRPFRRRPRIAGTLPAPAGLGGASSGP